MVRGRLVNASYTINVDENGICIFDEESDAYGEGYNIIDAITNYLVDMDKLISNTRSAKPRARLMDIRNQFENLINSLKGRYDA